jgi:hypothetical protein
MVWNVYNVQNKIIDSKKQIYPGVIGLFFSVLSTITNSCGTVNFHANIELYLTVVSLKSQFESRERPNCFSTISCRTQLFRLCDYTLMSLGLPCDDSVQASFSTVPVQSVQSDSVLSYTVVSKCANSV